MRGRSWVSLRASSSAKHFGAAAAMKMKANARIVGLQCKVNSIELLAKSPHAVAATRRELQWFVLNPLEELLMSQRARLVLDEGD